MVQLRHGHFRCKCKSNLWGTDCAHVTLAKIYQKYPSLFAVAIGKTKANTYLLENEIAKGNRREIYLTVGLESTIYCTVHCHKRGKMCSIKGHDGTGCEHTALLPSVFINHRNSESSTDDEQLLSEVKDEDFEDYVPPVLFVVFLYNSLVWFFCVKIKCFGFCFFCMNVCVCYVWFFFFFCFFFLDAVVLFFCTTVSYTMCVFFWMNVCVCYV